MLLLRAVDRLFEDEQGDDQGKDGRGDSLARNQQSKRLVTWTATDVSKVKRAFDRPSSPHDPIDRRSTDVGLTMACETT